jgi:hypothetical protein
VPALHRGVTTKEVAMAVTLSELKRLLGTPDVDDASVQLFATQGELVVAEQLASSGLSSGTLAVIELYLAAHFAVLADEHGGLKVKKIGQSEDHFRAPAADKVGYLTTRFGQQACAFDTTGTLTTQSQQLSGRAVISNVKWPCE